MILANEQVAQRLESARVPTMFRVHEQPDPAAIERLVAQLESLDVPTPPIPKAMAPGDATRLSGEISRRVIEYHRHRARRRVFTRSCCGPQAGLLLDRESRPCGAREPELPPLHLADPALSRPRRPSAWRPWAPANSLRRATSTRPRRGAAPLSARPRRSSTRRTTSASPSGGAHPLERGWEEEFEGEVTGVIEAGAFVSFDPGAGGGLRGHAAGAPHARRLYDLNDQRTALVGRRAGAQYGWATPSPSACARWTRCAAGSTSESRAGGADEPPRPREGTAALGRRGHESPGAPSNCLMILGDRGRPAGQ